MAVLLGLGPKTPKVVKYSSLQMGTSQLDLPIPIFWGQRRMDPNLIWYNHFKRHEKGAKGGKGGGGKGTGQYTYTAAIILALGEGIIDGIVNIWKSGSSKAKTTLSKLNLTFFSGTATQTPWSYVVTNYPAEALSYALTSYLASSKYDLGASAAVPSNSFECHRVPASFTYSHNQSNGNVSYWTKTTDYTVYDVLPSDCLTDLLTNTQYGLGFSSGDLSSITQYSNYVRAQGIFFSPLLVSQENANQVIDRWAMLTNSWIYWSGTQVQFVPLADGNLTGNGVTYTADNDVAYNLTLSDFIGGDIPVKVKRCDPADAYNRTRLQITDRTKAYVTNPIEFKDQTLIDLFGLRDNSSVSADEICDPAVGAVVAQLVGKRKAYLRNTYEFKLSYRFVRLLPGAIVTLTDPNIGLNELPVRISMVEEDDDGLLNVTAEEFPGTIGTYTGLTLPNSGDNGFPDSDVDPGNVNTPCIIESSSSFTGGIIPRLLVSASGGADWGGCYVYVSFDGVTYLNVGQISSKAVQGLLTATLNSHADPDNVNTLSIDASESESTPDPVTNADADSFRTLSYVSSQPAANVLSNSGELLSFGNVVATGTYTANLTYLRRGLYGTTIASHASGQQFTLIDSSLSIGCTIAYDLPSRYINTTVYFKFQSYNVLGGGIQDLSAVVAYQYIPTGRGFGTATGGVPSIPTGLTATIGSGYNAIAWNANAATDNVTSYQVWAAAGLSQPFGSATKIWEGLSTNYNHIVSSGSQWTYFIVAVNAVGSSSASAGVNATSTTVSYSLQIRGSTPGRKPNASEELFASAMLAGDKVLSGLPSSLLQCEIAPTNDWVITLKQNGVTVGTGTILAGATTGTWSFSSTVTFSAADFFKGFAPAIQDPTLSGVTYTIVGTRTT